MVALICALFVSFTYVVGQMKGVGVAFARFLNVPFDTGVLIGIGIVFFYAVLGGMKGITYTQVAQFCVLIFAFTVPAIFISLQMTGNPIPQIGFGSKGTDGVYLLEKLNLLSTDLGFDSYTNIDRGNLVNMFFITGALMFGTAGLPHVIVRFFTVPRVKDARISAGWALLFIAILYTTAPAVAVFARTNLINTLSDKPYSQVPEWFTNWEKTGLLSFEDKNNDGTIQYVADAQLNELTVDRDIIVLANPEIANLPNWVIALVAAGALAAALSTAAGLLLVISASVSHDLIKKMIKPSISEKGELVAARLSAVVAVCVAGYFGINPPDFVAATVALAFGLAAASFFPAIILGIFTKKMNKEMRPKKDGDYYIVNASSNIRTLNKMMNWNIPIEEAKTINGAILENLGYIPDVGAKFSLGKYSIRVISTKENAVESIRIKAIDPEYKLKVHIIFFNLIFY